MSDELNNLFSRAEILSGQNQAVRLAPMNLFTIETRTAKLRQQTRINYTTSPPITSYEESGYVFIEALAELDKNQYDLSIQDLERFAPRWQTIAPDNPRVCATVAHLMAEKYSLAYKHTPNLRQALNLDSEEVKAAFQEIYKQSIESIYTEELSLAQQVRWMQAHLTWRLEDLPPFWIAFSLTFTETIGATILALPIALARVGPIAGVIFILLLGLVNLMTIASLVEAIVRNGNMRYGAAFFAQLVQDYLGSLGSLVLNIALFVLNALGIIILYIGFSTIIAEPLNISPIIPMTCLFLTGLFMIHREKLDITAATAMIVAAVNLVILLCIMLLTVPHMNLNNLMYIHVPFINTASFETGVLELIFGVILTAFFGHTSAANAAKVVLHREPTGKALLWGNLAATTAAIIIYSLWVLIIGSAIPAEILGTTTSTVLTPLSAMLGSIVALLGAVYGVLGMGLLSILVSMLIFLQVREWLSHIKFDTDTSNSNLIQSYLQNKSVRFWLAASPLTGLFLFTVWLILTGRESFTGLISLGGVVALPIVGGIFPILMLVASRRTGDYKPGFVLRFIGHPILQGLIYAIYLASVFLHGLFILQDPLQRIVVTGSGFVIVAVTIQAFRNGSFRKRDVIELHVDHSQDAQAKLSCVSAGKALLADVTFNYRDSQETRRIAEGIIPNFRQLKSIHLELPATQSCELKIWTHQIDTEGYSKPLDIILSVSSKIYSPSKENGMLILPINAETQEIEFNFP